MPTLESLNDPWRTRCQIFLRTILRSEACRDACAQITDGCQTQITAMRLADVENNLPLPKESTVKSRLAVSNWLDDLDINTLFLEEDSYKQARAALERGRQNFVEDFVDVLLLIVRPLFRTCLKLCLETRWGSQDDTTVLLAQNFGEEIVFGGTMSWEDKCLIVRPLHRGAFALTVDDLYQLPWQDLTLLFLPLKRPNTTTNEGEFRRPTLRDFPDIYNLIHGSANVQTADGNAGPSL